MNKTMLCTLSAALFAGLCFPAQADEAAVRETVGSYVEAFNAKDLKAVAAMWTEKASHTDRETGDRTEGREAIVADIKAAFKDQPDSRLAGRIDRVRLIRPDVAGVEGQTSVGSPSEAPIVSAFSAILVKNDGQWQFDSIEESPLPERASSHDALRDLEWLVGRWVDDSDDVRVETTIRWTPGGAFLLRSYSVQGAEGDVQHGTQVIGWDPRSKEIRSWAFNSDGSFGDATWSASGDDWLIKSSQTLADGQAASGTYVLKRIDADAVTLGLIGHEIEGEPQPARPAVTMVRMAGETESASKSAEKPARSGGTER